MAGLGRRTFAPGEVLTASNVMNYLQDQAVMVFPNSGARGSAIGTALSEGMVTYLSDTNQLNVYDGTAYRQIFPSVANAGEIIQIVQAASVTTTSSTSTSFVSAGLSATITPTSTSSQIMILCHSGVGFNTRATFGVFTLFRGTVAGTNLGNGTAGMTQLYPSAAATNWTNLALTYLDSPSTTSAQTYTLGMRVSAAGGGEVNAQNGGATGIMLLLEVKG